jgi:hypothetical protein
MELAAGSETDYSLNLASSWDSQTEALIESGGTRVVVPAGQAERVRGTVVDYAEGGARGLPHQPAVRAA